MGRKMAGHRVKQWNMGVKSSCSMCIGYLWPFIVQSNFCIIQCTCVKMACNSKTASSKTKRSEVWEVWLLNPAHALHGGVSYFAFVCVCGEGGGACVRACVLVCVHEPCKAGNFIWWHTHKPGTHWKPGRLIYLLVEGYDRGTIIPHPHPKN